MQGGPSTAELLDACVVLFGSGINVSIDFINYLQPEGLRAAYRKKVLETHPDRAVTTGADVVRMNADFIKATMAYNKLSAVVMNGGIRPQENAAGENPAVNRGASEKKDLRETKERETTEKFYSGKIPLRKLLLCQFLYYSRCISWSAYIDALLWQRRQRPRLGKIAQELGMISEKEIQAVLKQRTIQEKFGESAIRMGLLTPYKLMVLLGKQRQAQRQIGDYFVQSGILTRRQVELMVRKQLTHNSEMP